MDTFIIVLYDLYIKLCTYILLYDCTLYIIGFSVSIIINNILGLLGVGLQVHMCVCVCASSSVSCDLTWNWQEATVNNKGMHTYVQYIPHNANTCIQQSPHTHTCHPICAENYYPWCKTVMLLLTTWGRGVDRDIRETMDTKQGTTIQSTTNSILHNMWSKHHWACVQDTWQQILHALHHTYKDMK